MPDVALVSINPIPIRVSRGTILFKDIPRLNNCRAVGTAEFSSLIFASDTVRKEFSIIRREGGTASGGSIAIAYFNKNFIRYTTRGICEEKGHEASFGVPLVAATNAADVEMGYLDMRNRIALLFHRRGEISEIFPDPASPMKIYRATSRDSRLFASRQGDISAKALTVNRIEVSFQKRVLLHG